jgi:hypothetical protein
VHKIGGWAGAAYQLHDDLGFGIINGGVGVSAEGEVSAISGLGSVANDDVADIEAQAGAAGDDLALIGEDSRDATAYDAAAKEGDSDVSLSHNESGDFKERLDATQATKNRVSPKRLPGREGVGMESVPLTMAVANSSRSRMTNGL